MRGVFVLAAILAGVCSAEVAGQTVQRPLRPSRGLFGGGTAASDPNRDRQELTLTASFLGGYEDFIVPGSQEGEIVSPAHGGSVFSGTTNASLRYWRGRTARWFSANARGESRMYLANVDPTIGGGLDLAANTQAGARNTVGVSQMFSYEPSLSFGAYGLLMPTVAPSELPGSSSGSAFLDQRSVSSITEVNAERRWTRRQTTTGTVTYLRQRFLDDLGYDTERRAAEGRHSWNLRRTTDLDVSYRYSQSEVLDGEGTGVPVDDQTVNAGFSYSRRLSPTRHLVLSGGAGAAYVQTQDPVSRAPLEYWMPSGNGTVRVDVGRTWAVALDYRRAVNVIPGLTLQSFATGAASLRANGRVGRRLEAMLSAAFANGRAGYGGSPARYESYSGTAQLHFAFSRCCATTVNYDYYYYDLHQVQTVQAGIPNQYDRNTVRAGISVWMPLFGTFAGGR